MRRFFGRLTPAARLALGLISLIVTLLLVIDLVLDLVPDQSDMHRRIRESTSERLAVQITSLIQTQEWDTLKLTVSESLARDKEILSIAVRQQDGRIVFHAGEHLRYWSAPPSGQSTLTHVRVPIEADHAHWGDVEISYKPVTPQTLGEWLQVPVVALAFVVVPAGFLAFYLYMRRALQYLDPASAVPDRVRAAFDVLMEGVAVIDNAGRIVLCNQAFRHLHPDAAGEMMGKNLSQLSWLTGGAEAPERPWEEAMRSQTVVSGQRLTITQPDGGESKLILNASPIQESGSKTRGCIVTFSDMTELYRINELLIGNLTELDAARAQVEEKNEELRILATRDSLTGCLNRGAFVAAAEPLFHKMRQEARNLSCIMADIDFFKRVNDTHGHMIGDQVITAVARALSSHMRASDLLCRFGGEEFCIVLPGASDDVAMEVAERVRGQIEQNVGDGIRSVETLHVTCSLGVASLTAGANNLFDLMTLADLALYHSKQTGRNRVTRWTEGLTHGTKNVSEAVAGA
ncbi:MAG TPA: GGDEF domain-containing protein [Rhodocyclaceae bacterium]|nr:GGDEF domain-containing protein [Rhodocyclaceae bacterium]